MSKEVLGTIYTEVSADFQRGLYPIARTIKAEQHDLAIVEKLGGQDMKVKCLGNIYGEDKGTGFAGSVFDKEQISPTITTMQGGNREPMIVDGEVKVIGQMDNSIDHTFESANRVYDVGGVFAYYEYVWW